MDQSTEHELMQRAQRGEYSAFASLVQMHRDRLKLMISSRLDSRVAQRIDDSDVIQEVFLRLFQDQRECTSALDQTNRTAEALGAGELSPYLWLRKLAIWTLGDIQRKHLGVQQRDPRREIPLHDGSSSLSIAKNLVSSDTDPLNTIVREERERALERLLNELEPIDREILMLRHGEQLSRVETAKVLNISVAAAAKRYTRALARIRQEMKGWEK